MYLATILDQIMGAILNFKGGGGLGVANCKIVVCREKWDNSRIKKLQSLSFKMLFAWGQSDLSFQSYDRFKLICHIHLELFPMHLNVKTLTLWFLNNIVKILFWAINFNFLLNLSVKIFN